MLKRAERATLPVIWLLRLPAYARSKGRVEIAAYPYDVSNEDAQHSSSSKLLLFDCAYPSEGAWRKIGIALTIVEVCRTKMRSIQAIESCCHDYQVAHSWLRVGSQCACASIRAPKALALLVLVRLLDLQADHESERFRLDSCEASRRQVSASVLVGLVPLAASLAACVRLPLWCGREPTRGRGSRWSRSCVRARRARAARGISSRLRALASVVRQKAHPWQRFTEAPILCPRLRGAPLRHRGAQAPRAPLCVLFLSWVRTVLATEYRNSPASLKAGPCAQLKCAFNWCVHSRCTTETSAIRAWQLPLNVARFCALVA